MLILVRGSNGSGKSRFAEKLCARHAGARYYAATMIPYGDEGRARKQKHIEQRRGLDFVTVECPYSLSDVPAGTGDTVLLEDVSNLLANTLFGPAGAVSVRSPLEQILELESRCRLLVAVTISGLGPNESNDEATRDYIAKLNALNAALADHAVAVVELRDGEPCVIKGELSWSN